MLLLKLIKWLDIKTALFTALYSIVLAIAALVYDAVNFIYQVFMALASAQIFKESDFLAFARRIYVVIGVVALFFIAYGLLRAIIDPDNATKNETAPSKVVQKVLISIMLLLFTPTIFRFAYTIQNVVVSQNIIGKIILGMGQGETTTSYAESGRMFASDIFISFFMPPSPEEAKEDTEVTCDYTVEEIDTCLAKVEKDGTTLLETREEVKEKGFFIKYAKFAEQVAKGNIKYDWLFQLLGGAFLVYVLVSLCIDLGLRAVKLGYYQLIAPIPILCRIIPSGKKIFDNWLKNTTSTFALVFIQLAGVLIGVFLIESLPGIMDPLWSASSLGTPPLGVRIFARVFVICGILMFMKQAPKLFSQMFGLSEGTFKLGIGDKLREGGIFAAGGFAAAAGLAAANRVRGIPENFAQTKQKWQTGTARDRRRIIGSALTLPARDLVRFGRAGTSGYKATGDAKSVTEFVEGAQKGVAQGLSAPTVGMRVRGTAADVAQSTRTAVMTPYEPYDTQRELKKAKRYDDVKSKRDEINTYVDSDKEIKAIDDAYSANIDNIKKQIESGAMDAATGAAEIKKIRGTWNDEKNKKRAKIISDKIKDGDLKMQSLLQSYAGTLAENRQILKESIIENYAIRDANGKIEYDKDGNAKFDLSSDRGKKGSALMEQFKGLSDEDLKKMITDGSGFAKGTFTDEAGNSIDYIFANEPSTISGKSSTAIKQRAMEEEKKKS